MAARSTRRRLGRLLIFAVSGLVILGTVGGSAVGEGRFGPRRHMLAMTNRDRADHDRSALGFADRLAGYAKSHSQAMADAGDIFHSSGDQLRAALAGYRWQLGGENVGVGGSLGSLEDAFMASTEHRKNILRRVYEHAAVGIVRQDGRIWITVIFYG